MLMKEWLNNMYIYVLPNLFNVCVRFLVIQCALWHNLIFFINKLNIFIHRFI